MSGLYKDLPLTTFPNAQDVFATLLDVTASDATLIKQYFEAYQSGDITLAQSIYSSIPSASAKAITAEKMNKVQQAIVALERFYQSDVQSYIDNKQSIWEGIVNQFEYKGNFNSTTQYLYNNYVSYTSNGDVNIYICKEQPPIGTYPTNSSYWRALTKKGEKGDTGAGLAFAGVWDSARTYEINDCVSYLNGLWNCIQTNTNQTPLDGSTYWTLVYSNVSTIYPISANQPLVQEDGELWFQLLD